MRVQKANTVVIYTEPFDDVPSSVSATLVRGSTGAAITPAPVCSVVGDRVAVTLLAATHTTTLDRLALTISATVDSVPVTQVEQVDVVGAHYLTLGALRTEPKLDDPSRFPDVLLAQIRDEIEEYVEESANVAFVPRWGSERHIGDDTSSLVLRTNRVRNLLSVKVDGVSQTLTDFDLLYGDTILRTSGLSFTGWDPIEVQFEHGYDRPPMKLLREMKKAIRSEAMSRGAQAPVDRLWEQTADGLTVRFSTADFAAGRYTGQLALDAAIHAYGSPRLGFA
jgi:hypothetical protein